ncbi:MAG: hypothetical protein ABSH38_10360 [Verrucomicrobiota bacterium]|jgi:hypothetical protein
MRLHFELLRLLELLLVFGLIAVLISLFESFCKEGRGRKQLDDLEDRVSRLEKPGGK